MPVTRLISIVDDDAWARHGLESLVQSMGFETRAFASAEDFLANECISETACLITDLKMPGLSGLALQRKLRADGHRTPIIIVTAHRSDLEHARAVAEGAAAVLMKPLDPEQLCDCLMRAITRG